MTFEEVKIQLEPILENYVKGLELVENTLVKEINFYKSKHYKWLENNDFRPGTFSRILSSVIASKFTSIKTLEYLNLKNWEDDFRESYIPDPWKKADYFGHFMDIAMLVRFYIFHSVYSQIETSHRIIIRVKNLRNNGKPAIIVNELTKTYDENFIRFIDFIRNAIHNNGYHYPKNANYNRWMFKLKNKDYNFEIGEPILLGFDEVLDIIEEMIRTLIVTLEHKEIMDIQTTPDIT